MGAVHRQARQSNGRGQAAPRVRKAGEVEAWQKGPRAAANPAHSVSRGQQMDTPKGIPRQRLGKAFSGATPGAGLVHQSGRIPGVMVYSSRPKDLGQQIDVYFPIAMWVRFPYLPGSFNKKPVFPARLLLPAQRRELPG